MRRLALILALVVVVQAVGCDEAFSPCACDPPNPPRPIENAAGVIEKLADSYRQLNYNLFASLLASEYTYFFNEPDSATGETQYDRVTELRLHQRLFDPENIPPTDPPLPADVWLQAVSITVSPQSAFAERPDLYTNATPPGPLDPARWIATEATYDADVFLQVQGETDYQVNGRCRFVVLEDRSKVIGDPGKFTIYHWADLDGATMIYRRSYSSLTIAREHAIHPESA